MITRPKVILEDLNIISYEDAWKYQTRKLEELKAIKLWNRDNEEKKDQKHYLLLCEHNPVYTLGKSGSIDHLLKSESELSSQGFEYFKINRGGDITYHGPGQITVYPIFDLDHFFNDVHKYVRFLEEVVIRTLATFGIEASREKDYTGVWIDGNPKRKICAIGVHMSRWVSMHGFALNINTDLNHFNNIVPCGIQEDNRSVTSMQKELGSSVSMAEVKKVIARIMAEVYEYEYLV